MTDPSPTKSQIITPEVIATLLERYERAIRVTELQYLPVKVAYLATFILSALLLDATNAGIAGLALWLVLTIIIRPRVAVELSQRRVSRIAPFLRQIPRWVIAACCVGYIWFVTRGTDWDGWVLLTLIWVLDAAVGMLERRQITPYIHWKAQIAQQHQTPTPQA